MGLRALLFLVLSLSLLLCERNWSNFSAIRSVLSTLTAPIQYSIDGPVEISKAVSASFVSKKKIIKENEQLRDSQFLLQEQVQRLKFLEQENLQLRNLLNSSKQFHVKTLAAQLLSIATSDFNQQAIIDKGRHNDLYVGQPVLDAYGVLGQVVTIGLTTSKVMLLTDSRSAVPAVIVRNNLQVIVAGAGEADTLRLVNIPETSDIQIGDFLVSSSLGQRFPEGRPIGIVNSIKRVPGERFMSITVSPSAHIDRSHHVLLIWVEQQPIDKELLQDNTTNKAAKIGKRKIIKKI